MLVPDAQPAALAAYAERIRLAVRSTALCDAERVIEVTASLGVCLSSLNDATPLVPATEEALGRAKRAGGDRIQVERSGHEVAARRHN